MNRVEPEADQTRVSRRTPIHPEALTVERAEELIGLPSEHWARQCHAVSLTLVKSGAVNTAPDAPPARVVRGSAPGLPSQHSWVIFGGDCYDPKALVLDLTLWSYDPSQPTIYLSHASALPHIPHGSGSIFRYGMPQTYGGPTIELTPTEPLSKEARSFLALLGPLDARGWRDLAHAPVAHGWPAAELIRAMAQTTAIRPLIPIDIVGMVTDLNPGGLYLAEAA